MKGEYEKAAVYFANAVIANPNNIDFWINKGFYEIKLSYLFTKFGIILGRY
jgi:hypothetical protein